MGEWLDSLDDGGVLPFLGVVRGMGICGEPRVPSGILTIAGRTDIW